MTNANLVAITITYNEPKTVEFEVPRDELAVWLAKNHPELIGKTIPPHVWREFTMTDVAPRWMQMLSERVTGIVVNGFPLPKES
jgi:hypothetical protein